MPTHAVRLTLAALAAAVLAALLAPGAALARATPSLTTPLAIPTLTTSLALGEPGGAGAGTTTSLKLAAQFAATGGDGVSDLEIAMPSGALLNTTIDNGACLGAAGPVSKCKIAGGSATLAGVSVPAALYLERAPGPDDLGGVQLVAGTLSAYGELSLQAPLDVGPTTTLGTHFSFTGLGSSAISSLALTFTKAIRLPSSCVPEPSVTMIAVPTLLRSLPVVADAPLSVRDCRSLPYTPDVVSSVAVNPHTRLARLTTTISQPAGQSATSRLKLSLAPGIVPRRKLAKCVGGSPCQIGTASLSSPVLPNRALADGTMTLGGTQSSPTVTIAFPEPTPLVLTGSLNRLNGQLTMNSLPDIPLTSMQLKFSGTSTGGPVLLADLANCQQNQFHATLFPTSGTQAAGVTGVAVYHGCPHYPHQGVSRPNVSVSVSGLAAGHPRLSVEVARGARSPRLRSVSISLRSGLAFAAAAVPAAGSRPAGISGERVADGILYVTFNPAVARRRLILGAPLLTETSALAHLAHGKEGARVRLFVEVSDTIGDRPTFLEQLTGH